MTQQRTLGVVLVTLAAVASVVVAILASRGGGSSDDHQEPAAQAPTSSVTPSTPAAPDGEVGADLVGRMVTAVSSEAGQPLPQTGQPGGFASGTDKIGPPAGLALQKVAGGGTVMVSSSDGPTGTRGPVLTGYAHSARGAALLTADYIARGATLGEPYRQFFLYHAPGLSAQDPAAVDDVATKSDPKAQEYVRGGYTAPRWFRFKGCDERFCTVETASPSIRETVGEIQTNTDIDSHPVFRVSYKWAGDRWELVDVNTQQVKEIDDTWEKWL